MKGHNHDSSNIPPNHFEGIVSVDEEPERKIAPWKKAVKWGLTGLAALVAYNSYYTVGEGEHAVVTTFGNPKRVVLNPIQDETNIEALAQLKINYNKQGISVSEGAGLYLKFPWQSVNRIDRRFTRWSTGAPQEISTSEKTFIFMDIATSWRVEDPLTYFVAVGNDLSATNKLDTTIDSKIGNELPHYSLVDIVRLDNRPMNTIENPNDNSQQLSKVTVGREKIMNSIAEKSKQEATQYGIVLKSDGVFATRVSYVEAVKTKVEGRMSAERLRMAETYLSEGVGKYNEIMGAKERDVKKAESEGRRRAAEIMGAADAQATKIYAEGYTEKDAKTGLETKYLGYNTDPEFYQFYRTLKVWDSMKDATLTIGTDNPLFGTMKGQNKLLTPSTKSSIQK